MNASTADLSWLPGDADEQLALGLRIVSNAYKSRVQTAETEIRQLKSQLAERGEQLQKDIQRLENLKKAVLTSIQEDRPEADDSSPFAAADATFQMTARRTVAELGSMEDIGLKGMRLDFRRAGPNNGTVLTPHDDPTGNADGRAFFRAARSRLSFETFNAFLASIKRLNNQQQDREETLKTAERLFGEANADLFEDFKALLTRHA
ncbi:hypothetical protein, conserved [Eimeria acervulina]|uniref:At4g15545-like C-terminal domain-containing protein n=1 Tax=Eimeria acervulina TaxID=5801 RepID=U6GG31_EIMAC|nr:hypothetical protein, conserved [Eimeria acervulina]CDI79211.1 hypothetical protein, conserved [Eimeria acervulina]